MTHRVELTNSAQRDLDAIAQRYAAAILQFAFSALAENPVRVGNRLGGDLAGLLSARRGDYRILYEIIDDEATVVVHRIRHRAHAYRPH